MMLLAMSKNTSRYITLPVLLLYIAACASTDKVPMSVPRTDDSIGWQVSVGDDLVVTTMEGQVYEFVLQDIEQDYLVGENVKVATKDISKVEKRVHPAEATASQVLGVLIGVLVVAFTFFLFDAATTPRF